MTWQESPCGRVIQAIDQGRSLALENCANQHTMVYTAIERFSLRSA
jgi:hypothetical protein